MVRDCRQIVVVGALSAVVALGLCGCASKYVSAVVRNGSGAAVSVVEVDYPSASFGTDTLAAGAEYDYRFKILGDGPTKIQWLDASGKEHSGSGPALNEGEQGPLVVTLEPDGRAVWDSRVTK
jgi:hypothetical protein